jgi:hypothetical protein
MVRTNRTTILVEKTTRDVLKQIGTKGQSYDNLINWLIRNKSRQIREEFFKMKKKDSLDNEFADHLSSELQ